MQVKDQLGHFTNIPSRPLRIISLVPSQTALLFTLGLDQEVVGITKFCTHPENWRRSKSIVGGTKTARVKTILELNPNLILGNREENTKEQIEELKTQVPVWMSDVVTLDDALEMIATVGTLTYRREIAEGLVQKIQDSFKHCPLTGQNRRVLYLIWRKPWMAAGAGTFINSILSRIGLTNVVTTPRYPEVSERQIASLNPELVLLPSEPFPFGQRHADEVTAIVPTAEPVLVEGEWFSWYGSHLLHAVDYFRTLPFHTR